jgi:hypothetical protein
VVFANVGRCIVAFFVFDPCPVFLLFPFLRFFPCCIGLPRYIFIFLFFLVNVNRWAAIEKERLVPVALPACVPASGACFADLEERDEVANFRVHLVGGRDGVDHAQEVLVRKHLDQRQSFLCGIEVWWRWWRTREIGG